MPKWTPDQQTAIDDRGGALLVSAAAGSGKTAVLTERVLRRLTDENDPVDIDRLLLVTFTNAAAAEMRERIGAALGAAVAANPRDTVCGGSCSSCTARKSRLCMRCACRSRASRRRCSASRPTFA